jgi:PAS domain-containing protein
MDIATIIGGAVSGGVLTQLVNYFAARRTAQKDSFQVVIERWEKDNERLRTQVETLQTEHESEKRLLLSEVDKLRREVSDLRSKVGMMEHINSDIPTPMWLKDDWGRYLSVNHSFEKMFGKEAADVLGYTDKEIWGDEVATQTAENDRQVQRAGLPINTVEEYGSLGTFYVLKWPKMAGSARIGVGAVAFPAN